MNMDILLTDDELNTLNKSELTIEDDENMKESSAAAAAAGGVFLAAAGWPTPVY